MNSDQVRKSCSHVGETGKSDVIPLAGQMVCMACDRAVITDGPQ